VFFQEDYIAELQEKLKKLKARIANENVGYFPTIQ